MFSKSNMKNEKVDTLIGENTKLKGKIEGNGNIRIDGIIEGDMMINGNVVLGEKGKINGNITCSNIYISGNINGNVYCKEQLRISNTGNLIGDIKVKNFIVDENAIFEGNCKMNNDNNTLNNKGKKIKAEN